MLCLFPTDLPFHTNPAAKKNNTLSKNVLYPHIQVSSREKHITPFLKKVVYTHIFKCVLERERGTEIERQLTEEEKTKKDSSVVEPKTLHKNNILSSS